MSTRGKSSFPRTLAAPITARELIARVGEAPLSVSGDVGVQITAVAAYDDAAPGCVVFQKSRKADAARELAACPAALVIEAVPVPERVHGCAVHATDPTRWFVKALTALFPREHAAGIDASAQVSPLASLASGVRIEASVVIEDDVVVGARTRIAAGAVILSGTRIGEDCVIGAHTVIGEEGLATVPQDDRSLLVFPHLGAVLIGDRVEIGANGCIVRGILKDTIIGSGVKMANHVNIGHNCRIGEDCWISGHVMVCGSAVLERAVMVGARAVINNRITVGEGARVGLGSVVMRSVAAGSAVLGSPAAPVPFLRPF